MCSLNQFKLINNRTKMHGGKFKGFISLLLVITAKASNPTSVVIGDLEYLLHRFDNQNGRLNYYDAYTACAHEGEKLAIINDANIQNAIQQQLELWKHYPNDGWKGLYRGYWIGGSCSYNCKVSQGGLVANEPSWKWNNGFDMFGGYTNWYSPLDPNGGSNQAAYIYNFDDMPEYPNIFGAWGDDDLHSYKNYICQRDKPGNSDPCQNGGTYQSTSSGSYTCHCKPGFSGGNCETADSTSVFVADVEYLLYRFDDQNGRLDHNDANTACVKEGGKLAIINTAEIQSAIQHQIELWKHKPNEAWSDLFRGYWIGGSCSGSCKVSQGGSMSNKHNWKWSDGSGMYDEYENWYSPLDPNGSSNVAVYVYNFDDMPEYPNIFGAWGDDFTFNPKNYICQRDDHCHPNPCKNSGTCIGTNGGYKCDCPVGVIGTYCETDDHCHPNPCRNSGTCFRTDGSYYCDCPIGVIGTNCEIDLCAKNPCENGGTCIGTDGAYECECPAGFIGTNCQTELCRKDTCKNGGNCIQTSSEAKCECQSGYIGSRCEIDLCASNSCQNGGTCVGTDSGHICSCPVGFNGANCETDICDLEICQHGGTCQHAAVTGFKCECKKGYEGTTCQIDKTWIPIVAGTLGGFVLLIIAVTICCCVKKKRSAPSSKRTNRNSNNTSNMSREVRQSDSQIGLGIYGNIVSNTDEESTT